MGLPLMLEPLVYGIVNAILEGRLHTAHKSQSHLSSAHVVVLYLHQSQSLVKVIFQKGSNVGNGGLIVLIV